MEGLEKEFEERLAEINTYLDLLATFEEQIGSGKNKVGLEARVITTTQQRILYSSVYLQLYNLIEATITKCTQALYTAILKDGRWCPTDLSPKLREEWVRYLAKTHTEQNSHNRLTSSLKMFDHLIQALPVNAIEIDKGNSGNWHDVKIYRFAKRLGCVLNISRESNEAIKQPIRDDCGALKLIAKLRNDLAHGNVSFVECGANVTVEELKKLKSITATYMQEVVISFKEFIKNYHFLQPESRPMVNV